MNPYGPDEAHHHPRVLRPPQEGDAGTGDAVRPHWLVFNDQIGVDSEWEALNRKGVGGVAGVTFVRVVVEEDRRDDN